MEYFKTKDSHMAVKEVNGVEFCTHITKDKVEWILFSLVSDKAVECSRDEVFAAFKEFKFKTWGNL